MNTTPRIFRFLILFASVSCFSPVALGQNWTGDGDGVNWIDATNWSDSTVLSGTGSFPSVSGTAAMPLNVVQALGQTEGLFIDDSFLDTFSFDSSTINLIFDSGFGIGGELDEIFAVAGNQSTLLESLIGNGQINISGTTEDVGVFFDAGNNRTSIGFIATAIPEPNTLVMLCALSAGMCLRRRR